MLQRRKKYKNRTILGYKNLAVGIINMSQVSIQEFYINVMLQKKAAEIVVAYILFLKDFHEFMTCQNVPILPFFKEVFPSCLCIGNMHQRTMHTKILQQPPLHVKA